MDREQEILSLFKGLEKPITPENLAVWAIPIRDLNVRAGALTELRESVLAAINIAVRIDRENRSTSKPSDGTAVADILPGM